MRICSVRIVVARRHHTRQVSGSGYLLASRSNEHFAIVYLPPCTHQKHKSLPGSNCCVWVKLIKKSVRIMNSRPMVLNRRVVFPLQLLKYVVRVAVGMWSHEKFEVKWNAGCASRGARRTQQKDILALKGFHMKEMRHCSNILKFTFKNHFYYMFIFALKGFPVFHFSSIPVF